MQRQDRAQSWSQLLSRPMRPNSFLVACLLLAGFFGAAVGVAMLGGITSAMLSEFGHVRLSSRFWGWYAGVGIVVSSFASILWVRAVLFRPAVPRRVRGFYGRLLQSIRNPEDFEPPPPIGAEGLPALTLEAIVGWQRFGGTGNTAARNEIEVTIVDGKRWGAGLGEYVAVATVVPSNLRPARSLIPTFAIMGYWSVAGFLRRGGFAANPPFVAALHRAIAATTPESDAARREAADPNHRSITVTDLRTAHPGGDAPTEDILGAFEIVEGRLGRYVPNPNYAVFTAYGLPSISGPVLRMLLGAVVDANE